MLSEVVKGGFGRVWTRYSKYPIAEPEKALLDFTDGSKN